jgi:type IV pilus assembly protein PilM
MFGFKKTFVRERMLIVDVGTQYVKVLSLTVKNDSAKLHDYRILNVMQGGKRFFVKEIAKIVKKAIIDMGVTDQFALASISGKSVIVRIMDMPAMTLKELKSSLRYQTDLHIPFDISEAMIDCQILHDHPAPEGKMKVLIAAAPQKDVARILDVLHGAGLIPRRMDVDVISLANAFEWGLKDESEPFALVNMGASRTNLAIMSHGKIGLCRELSHGCISFTEAIAVGLNCSFEEAEKKKIVGDPEILKYIEESLKPLSSALIQSFDFFEGSMGARVGKVYLSGGGALIRGVVDYLKDLLHRNVFVWNPLRSVDIEGFVEREKELLQQNSPLLTIGIGIGFGEAAFSTLAKGDKAGKGKKK